MVASSILDEDSSDDSVDLSYEPFAKKSHSSATSRRQSERPSQDEQDNAAAAPTAGKRTTIKKMRPPAKPLLPRASRRQERTSPEEQAKTAALPVGITSSEQLVWYFHDNDDETETAKTISIYPCRVCKPAEARFINLEMDSWDRSEVSLLQALGYPALAVQVQPFRGGRDRTLANKMDIVPYYGDQQDARKDTWCPNLWKRYCGQLREDARRQYKALSPEQIEATRIYLHRVLEASQTQQQHDSDSDKGSESDSSGVNDDHDDKESSIASEDLEIPYDENLVETDVWQQNDRFAERSTEPLRPGDEITYCSPIFVAGDSRGIRTATVLNTDPDRRPMLTLSNGEVLPDDTRVKRTKVMEYGKLHPHPYGFFRPIESFRITKQGQGGLHAGFHQESERVGKILDRNMSKLQKRAQASGFAPMGLLHQYKKFNSAAVSSKRRKASQQTPSESIDSPSDDSLSGRMEGTSRVRRALPSATADSSSSDDSDSKPQTDIPSAKAKPKLFHSNLLPPLKVIQKSGSGKSSHRTISLDKGSAKGLSWHRPAEKKSASKSKPLDLSLDSSSSDEGSVLREDGGPGTVLARRDTKSADQRAQDRPAKNLTNSKPLQKSSRLVHQLRQNHKAEVSTLENETSGDFDGSSPGPVVDLTGSHVSARSNSPIDETSDHSVSTTSKDWSGSKKKKEIAGESSPLSLSSSSPSSDEGMSHTKHNSRLPESAREVSSSQQSSPLVDLIHVNDTKADGTEWNPLGGLRYLDQISRNHGKKGTFFHLQKQHESTLSQKENCRKLESQDGALAAGVQQSHSLALEKQATRSSNLSGPGERPTRGLFLTKRNCASPRSDVRDAGPPAVTAIFPRRETELPPQTSMRSGDRCESGRELLSQKKTPRTRTARLAAKRRERSDTSPESHPHQSPPKQYSSGDDLVDSGDDSACNVQSSLPRKRLFRSNESRLDTPGDIFTPISIHRKEDSDHRAFRRSYGRRGKSLPSSTGKHSS